MVRKIIFPMVIFVTLLAAANVRSVPLLVLAIAEIIFAGMMIALSIFQRSRLKAEPVRRFLHLQKGQPCECRIKVDNHSPFPVSRFRLEAEHGYGFDPNNREEVTLYGGTDKDEGYLKIEPEADHCGLNRVRLKSIRCYDWFLLSSFPKKLKTDMQIAILPDAKLKMHIIRRLQSAVPDPADEDAASHEAKGGTEPEDIRPYREGDPLRHIYWKQSAKMNELWVKEYGENMLSYPVVEADDIRTVSLSLKEADCFYRIFYALLAGMLEAYGSFVFRHYLPSGEKDEYRINNIDDISALIIAFYRIDFTSLCELRVNEEFTPTFTLTLESYDLSISRDGTVLKKFGENVTDNEINETVIIV